MLTKDAIFKKFFATIAELRKNPPPLLLANLRHAGAFVDVRKLIDCGWEQKNGLQKGAEVLEKGSVVLRRNIGKGRRKSEFRILLSYACNPTPSANGGHSQLKDDALVAAYVGTGPYNAYLRWLDFPNVSQADLKRLVKEIENATVSPVGLFDDDFELVVADTAYSGEAPLNAHDSQLAALYNVARQEMDRKNYASVRRIYTPMVRALLTDDDPAGRSFISDTDDAGLLGQIMSDLAVAKYREGVRAVMGVVLLKFWDRMEAEFDSRLWMQVASLACWLEEFILAGYLYGRGVPMIKKGEERREAAFDASRNVLFFLRKFPKDLEELDFASACLDDLAPDLAVDEDARVLHILMRAWMQTCNNGEVSDDVFDLAHTSISKGCAEFDATLPGDEETLKHVPCSVKAQLSWQTFLALFDGKLRQAIESFPHAAFSDGSRKSFLPPTTFIAGLPIWDVWRGIFRNFDDYDADALFNALSARPLSGKPDAWVDVGYGEQTDLHFLSQQRVVHVAKRQLRDLDSLVVEGMFQDDKGGDVVKQVACLPYLPKEREANAANATFGVWEYFPWRFLSAADARVELENGRQIYATLPYYAADKLCAARGQWMRGLLAIFPTHVWKSDDAVDSFRQGIYNELLFRSGVKGCGVVRKVEKTRIAGVADELLRFTIDVAEVGTGIPLVVNPFHFTGDVPGVGVRIGFEGWVYLDGHGIVESKAEYERKYPEGREVILAPAYLNGEADDDESKSKARKGKQAGKEQDEGGKADGSKTDGGALAKKPGILLVECKVAGTSHVDDIVGKMATVTTGARLELRRDKSNAWDSDAIAVMNPCGERIGFIPQNQNSILSRLMDGGKKLYAIVMSKKTEDRFFSVAIGVYLED